MNELLTLLMAVCFLVTGWHFVKRPEAIQQWVLQLHQKNHLVAEMNPLRNWIDKKSFVIALRVPGVLSLFNFFMLMMAFFSLQEPHFDMPL
ncbi:hypothetical protein MNBD_GAMMA17-498 [hydrothermal vent metagenome]|uniref:Uncharacterized protein n=1 Tax=hydrothermal vent metagenome TaxID=652676 RepID=A0A3B0ZIH2_9ZZZZ